MTGLLYEYQQFDPNALSQNKITVSNNKYYDKYSNGVWQNPYQTKKAIAITPPVMHSNRKDIYFKLPQSVFLSNIRNQIVSIQININNGNGYQNLSFDTAIPLHFYENKIHDLDFKITLINGQILYSHSKFKINDPALESIEKAALVFDDGRVFIYEDGNPFSSAVLTIRRIPGNNEITRPFIIAEGFDTGHITKPEIFGGDRDIESFNNSLINSGNLINILEIGINDYDLIYIDWNNGTGDMKANSRVLEEVLEWVNDNKIGNEPNVLLGQSMGGVIGRYTLASMEDRNIDHDVRLFIAHDSPMQGSNTPLAVQHFARHIHHEYIKTPAVFALGEIGLPILFGLDAITGGGLENLIENLPDEDEEEEFTYIRPSQLLRLQDRPAARQLNY